MEETMIERVARAISKAIELQDSLAHYAYEDRKEAMDEVARAAIEAMRKPTFDMVEAGQKENNILPEPRDPPNAFVFLSRDEMTEAWEAMIDVALTQA